MKSTTIIILITIGVLFYGCCMHKIERYPRSGHDYYLLNDLIEGTQVTFESNLGLIDTITYDPIKRRDDADPEGRGVCGEDYTYYFFESQNIPCAHNFGFKTLNMSRETKFSRYNTSNAQAPDTSIELHLKIDTNYASCRFKGPKQSVVINGKTYDDCIEMHFKGFAKILYQKHYGILRIHYLLGTKDSVFTAKEFILKKH